MDIAYISLIIFIIITIIYCFFGKVPITIGTGVVSEEDYFNILSDVSNQNIMRLGIYFLIVIITQFVINTLYLINKCGGSAGNNIGAAALITFLPWIFIFGAMIVILILFPGFKGAFSNVVGYFAISSSANQILANILDTDTNIEDNMKKEGLSDEKKTDLKKTAELILKLCGNKSLLINQMSPENFLGIWQMMKSLMKENQGDFSKERQDLLNLVVMKDNIGEMMWYIYTGVLLTSIISFNLASRGCIKNAEQLKASHDEYLQQEEELKKQKELNDSQTVTLT